MFCKYCVHRACCSLSFIEYFITKRLPISPVLLHLRALVGKLVVWGVAVHQFFVLQIALRVLAPSTALRQLSCLFPVFELFPSPVAPSNPLRLCVCSSSTAAPALASSSILLAYARNSHTVGSGTFLPLTNHRNRCMVATSGLYARAPQGAPFVGALICFDLPSTQIVYILLYKQFVYINIHAPAFVIMFCKLSPQGVSDFLY